MPVHAFHFDSNRLRDAFAPRRPRHPLVKLGIGLLGLGVLALLVFFSVFVGIAMLAIGVLYRLTRQRRPVEPSARAVVNGEYRIVAKHVLPSA